MKTIILILILCVFTCFQSNAQLHHVKKNKLYLLEIKDEQILAILNNVIQYEKENCSSYSEDRQYYIQQSIMDTIALASKITIRSTNTNRALLNPLFGIFLIEKHIIFIDKSFIEFFRQLKRKIVLKQTTINREYAEKHNIIILDNFNDDTQTIWEFLFLNGKFYIEWFDGQCKNQEKLYQQDSLFPSKMHEIEIIEDAIKNSFDK